MEDELGESSSGSNNSPNTNNKQIILEDFFYLYGKSSLLYVILLADHGLLCTKVKTKEKPEGLRLDENNFVDVEASKELISQFQQLNFKDIVGCQCMRAQFNVKSNNSSFKSPERRENGDGNEEAPTELETGPEKAYLCVYAYPQLKRRFPKGTKRQRLSLTFTIDRSNIFRDNLTVAEHWRDTIRACITGVWPVGRLYPKKQLLVLVNPRSGSGKALNIFKQRISPVLIEASVHFQVVVTRRANHAMEMMRDEMELGRWNGVVIVGGDGLIFEVVNGLMNRPDWSTAIKMPLGVVPGGSGNGLYAAINHAVGESLSTNQQLSSAFNLAKGRVSPMDLVRVELPNRTLYSFLAIAWGIIADIDIESERLRSIGETRFTLWAIPRIANLRHYRGRLSYQAAPGYMDWKKHHPISTSSSKVLARSTSTYDHGRRGEHPLLQHSSSMDNASEMLDEEGEEALETKEDPKGVPPLVRVQSVSVFPEPEPHSSPPATPLGFPSPLPPLTHPVPSDWTQMEEDFVLVCAAFQTHIGNNVFMAPDAALDDGLLWLILIRKGVTRSQMIQCLLTLDSGSHVDYPWVEMVPVRAFRLEPLTEGGHLTVDGELVEYGPIQAQVLPSVARIITH